MTNTPWVSVEPTRPIRGRSRLEVLSRRETIGPLQGRKVTVGSKIAIPRTTLSGAAGGGAGAPPSAAGGAGGAGAGAGRSPPPQAAVISTIAGIAFRIMRTPLA